MSNFINKIKFWYKELTTQKISFEKKGIKPRKDWQKVLLVVFIIMVGLASFSYYFYIEIDKGTFFGISEEDSTSEVKINNKLLEKVTKDITDRENTLLEIKNNKKYPPNPAL